MSQISSVNARTTTQQLSNLLLSSIQRTQRELLDVQTQIATGKKINTPSDDPARTSKVLDLHGDLEAREQFERNLQHALSILNNTDSALADVTDIVLQTQSLASSQIGIGSDATTRMNQATVVDEQLSAMIEIANRQFQGIALFGGTTSLDNNGRVFEEFLGGIRYLGSRGNIGTDVGLLDPLAFNSNGTEAFGSLSTRVISQVDLDPSATPTTRLADLNGVNGLGIRKDAIEITINGGPAVQVDLSDADTLEDVATRVNNALGGAGSLAVVADGLELTVAAGNSVQVDEVGSGNTASDLGIVFDVTAGGAAVVTAGGDVDPRITELTALSSFAGIDLTSGLKITHGNMTKVADFSAATNVREMINVINNLGMGLRMEINADGTALNMVSEVSGIDLSVGENSGGNTATDLGLRTLDASTLLEDFRHGLGVEGAVGEDDFAVQLHDGTSFSVNIDGAATVGDVLNAINTAAAGAGLTIGVDFDAALASDGNGITLVDNTAGGNDFAVTQLSTSHAAENLGIYRNAGAATTLAGDDNAQVRVDSVFTHMINLREALLNNDESGITFAAEGLTQSSDDVARARADVGVRTRRVEDQVTRSAELMIAERTMLSEIEDADLTEVITRFQQLQQQMQASLQVGATNLQLSLLDFLR